MAQFSHVEEKKPPWLSLLKSDNNAAAAIKPSGKKKKHSAKTSEKENEVLIFQSITGNGLKARIGERGVEHCMKPGHSYGSLVRSAEMEDNVPEASLIFTSSSFHILH